MLFVCGVRRAASCCGMGCPVQFACQTPARTLLRKGAVTVASSLSGCGVLKPGSSAYSTHVLYRHGATQYITIINKTSGTIIALCNSRLYDTPEVHVRFFPTRPLEDSLVVLREARPRNRCNAELDGTVVEEIPKVDTLHAPCFRIEIRTRLYQSVLLLAVLL